MNRRIFIRTTTYLSAGFGFLPFCSLSSNNKMNVTLGAHPWVYAANLPNHDITPKLEAIFADVSGAGYEGIELMHHPLRSAQATQKIKALSSRYSLPVIGTSFGAPMWDADRHKDILNDITTILTNLEKVGGRTLGTSVGNAKRKKTQSELDAQAGLLRQIIGIAQLKGITINLHNHTYEVEHNMHDLRGTLARLPDIKLGPDIGWLVRADVDPVAFIQEFGDQIVFLHLRDQYADGRWTEHVGQGATDFRAIGQALAGIRFSGDAVVELAHPRDFTPTQSIRESLEDSRKFIEQAMNIT